MEETFIEAVASSLLREFLSRKGLKKTSVTLEEEYPRPPQSINNRNELRDALHLNSLYRENKLSEKPLKTLLELITKYFLESFGKNKKSKMTLEQNPEDTKIFTRGHQKKQPKTSHLDVCDLSDSEAGESSAVSDTSVTHILRSDAIIPPKKPHVPHEKWKNLLEDDLRIIRSAPESDARTPDAPSRASPGAESAAEAKNIPSEAQRPRSGRIVRGMMCGPIANSPEDSLRKRGQRRSSATYQPKAESQPNGHLPKTGDPQNHLQLGKEFSTKLLGGSSSSAPHRSPSLLHSITQPERPSSSLHSITNQEKPSSSLHSITQQEKPPHSPGDAESAADAYINFKMKFLLRSEQGDRPKPSGKMEDPSAAKRKTGMQNTREEAAQREDIRLDDIEDDIVTPDIAQLPAFLPRSKVQVEGHPIDLQQALELKRLLFGSPLSCFSEEWKIQNFTFSNIPFLEYGLVQKKGGPCGVLAAVQACVLKHLLFGKDSDISRTLQPSQTLRTRCLCNAIADILWRAGDSGKAAVTLSSGRQQFSPAGRYKADGILESLIIYRFTRYEELVTFLQQNIPQFESGPFGCILLTLSAILSRSLEQVQKDFDVPTNCLIGAHAYCTQELVNLIMGGRAVSNVFNDVMELDSGNGNITLLKGISSRCDIGFMSLFEHYSVCQVGSYLKTPKYPIWVVCSESHFSVLFCLKKELTSDWKAERRFDLYYYDGLANQQEEIRLTIDTTRSCTEDRDSDLIPPLEYCIRTKWKGAVVDWNGTEPIL